jgi:hypothetical protein
MAYPTLIALLGDPTSWTPPSAGYANIGVNLAGQIVIQQSSGALSTLFPLSTPVVVTTASYTLLGSDTSIIADYAGVETLTLGTPSAGRQVLIRTVTNNTVVSASANVIPLAGGGAGTAILSATAGKWALLQGDGSNWNTMAAN